MLRAVLDTNVVLAAKRTAHPQSPNAEIIRRWMDGQFVWLVSDDVVAEYAEKLLAKGIAPERVEHFLADLLQFGEEVPIRFFHFSTTRWMLMTWPFCWQPLTAQQHTWSPMMSI